MTNAPMPAADARAGRVFAVDFLAVLGWLSLVILAIGLSPLRKPAANGFPSQPPILILWFVVAIALGAVVGAAVAFDRFGLGARTHVLWTLARSSVRGTGIVLAVATIALAAFEANRLLLVLPALATAAWLARTPGGVRRASVVALTFVAASASWCFVESLPFTRLDLLFLGAVPDDTFVLLVFAIAFALVNIDAVSPAGRSSATERRAGWILALAVFVPLALRTDFMGTDWIYYHRSYYANPATFVREGHWLLWDVPSQYGFLSELTIALLPGATTWDSLTLLLAGVAVATGAGLFALLRYERRGVVNVAVSILVAASVTVGDAAARWPAGGVAYPQFGLRTIWLDAGIAILLGIYLARSEVRRTRLRLLGHAVWTLALFWSSELGIWQTVFWLPCVALLALPDVAAARTLAGKTGVALARAAEALAFPLTFAAAVTLFYLARAGHAPDWFSYIEFSIAYSNGVTTTQAISQFGQGWYLAAMLVTFAALAVWAIRTRAYRSLPVIAGCWLAIWAASSYYVGETYSLHANALLPVILYASAAAAIVLRHERAGFAWVAVFRAMNVPLAIVLIAGLSIGDQWQHIVIPAPQHLLDDASSSSPVLEPELAALLDRAGVPRDGRVVLPNRIGWTKISLGLIMPFRRMPDGSVTEVVSWLPISPVGAYNTLVTLPASRRSLYLERFLADSPERGWIVGYHEAVNCRAFSPSLRGTVTATSENFSIARCR